MYGTTYCKKKNPWGANNRDLLSLYQNANASECPLVVDTSTPSCGNSRFGCWTCTVVTDDSSLRNTIENGEEWMEPLLELREELKETQDPVKRREVRSFKRRIGQMKLIDDARKNGFDKKIQESKMELATGENNNLNDPYSQAGSGTIYPRILPGVSRKATQGTEKGKATRTRPTHDAHTG